jgi:hypothetical protein
MVAPRLSQWHPRAPQVCLWSATAILVVFGTLLALFVFMLWRQRPTARPLARLARGLVTGTERSVIALGRRLSIDADRAAHSLIRINNTLARIDPLPTAPERVLLLLPRCLTKEQIRDARSIAEERGVPMAVVGGGEAARQKILQHLPHIVIGVACERDLISGMRDVGDRLRVLGIPNTRPHGPCKDTCIDMDELRSCLDEAISGTALAEPEARYSGARSTTLSS